MIFKLIAVLAVLFFVYTIFFKKNREKTINKNNKDENIEDVMVECPTCGTYVSKKEGILSNGQYFCSSECLKK
ncbi:hypothetical protein CPU12_06770 [Malaciobacter molluscorum LMG 25693]|uniref:Prokaryotic metallothionein n=1 Tax=Malaciobacter molluscorum LMG 25693 TaxID=870501 RepID=A0A2G1DI32_9BACT|nr:PP0621 family protein [Malaciobacter molluscorum]AXX92390.1 hypothetical protein AMOL_1415 [Malaciobacter molluscorum LMG 25693]PHO18162.1 hypothetical protein CPU12_06770 [Malaciobacter molluscorum LMG 25693]RXJ93951.1 hypothetical protein CRV00_08715 [Malaciobacter molluscorum]